VTGPQSTSISEERRLRKRIGEMMVGLRDMLLGRRMHLGGGVLLGFVSCNLCFPGSGTKMSMGDDY
jgi:hypothetical protein